MKASNIFLIVLTSIITFIGLAVSKLYDRYIKNNILVQGAVYLFFTLIAFRFLAWAAKPFIPHGVPTFLQGFSIPAITVNIPEVTPLCSLIIFLVALGIVCIFFKHALGKFDEN